MQNREPTLLIPPSTPPPNPDSPTAHTAESSPLPLKKGFPKRITPTSPIPSSPKIITNQTNKPPVSPNSNTVLPVRPFPGNQADKTATISSNNQHKNVSVSPVKSKARKQSQNNILFDLKLLQHRQKMKINDNIPIDKIAEASLLQEKESETRRRGKQRRGSCNIKILPNFEKNSDVPTFLRMRKNSQTGLGINPLDSPDKKERRLIKKKSVGWLQEKNFQFQRVDQQPHEEDVHEQLETPSSPCSPRTPPTPRTPRTPTSPTPKIKIRKAPSDNDHKWTSPAFLSMKKQRCPTPPERKACIQNFKILRQLGKGTFGRVVLAAQRLTGLICAIKIISKREVRQGEMVQQLYRELKIQLFANHPNIVKLYGFFQDIKYFYIIMECAMDDHLSKIVKNTKELISQNKAALYTSQICKAFAYLHSHKIIHRDMKPQNVILHQDVIKLADFGWSVKINEELRNTFCGTPVYLSPEQLSGQDYDQSVDVWTIGMTLYEMLYGRNPFGITCKEELVRIVDDEVKFQDRSISEAAKDFIQRCLHKKSSERAKVRELLQHDFLRGRKQEIIDFQRK